MDLHENSNSMSPFTRSRLGTEQFQTLYSLPVRRLQIYADSTKERHLSTVPRLTRERLRIGFSRDTLKECRLNRNFSFTPLPTSDFRPLQFTTPSLSGVGQFGKRGIQCCLCSQRRSFPECCCRYELSDSASQI